MSNEEFLAQLQDIRNATLLQNKEIYATLLQNKEISNTEEACLFLGIKKNSLYDLVKKRKIKFYKSKGGKLTYFKRKDLEKWMTAICILTKDEERAVFDSLLYREK